MSTDFKGQLQPPPPLPPIAQVHSCEKEFHINFIEYKTMRHHRQHSDITNTKLIVSSRLF